MFIRRSEYQRLRDCEAMKHELEREVQRLSEQLTAQVTDCKIGVWCNDCIHQGHDRSIVKENPDWAGFFKEVDGEVYYCKKHLHDLCPEFEGMPTMWRR